VSEVWVIHCGTVAYEEARAAQRRLKAARQAETVPDLLLLLEHPPVYTRGRRSDPAELPMGVEWYEAQGIEVCDTDRGGRVTYHGPGQLVAYPIVSLRPYGDDVHAYVRSMEQVMIEALADHGVGAGTITGLTGVWTAAGAAPATALCAETADAIRTEVARGTIRKIGSIGVHVSRSVTTHGLAVNVNNDLQPFEWVVPCGIDGCRMTSLSRELGSMQDVDGFASTVISRFAEVYERDPIAMTPVELAGRIDGVGQLAGSAVSGAVR
jgi:lipoyl(octanoyl) transferase